ncbi:hypothetical protein N5D61_05275 [Pseudomonas sp. GD03842]|uniref:hypothetical protein n=1 Tax=Pseudomonas sp. GD03842 TaxID=2975385 RepID=UPI00244C1761|nr:hypothetical protein [Pseudomonas sp. GD03842]MDH0745750.1 hypothetical protein [Pseudomonas sp. GD03842]
MTETVIGVLLDIFEKAELAGEFDGASATSFHSRDSAYAKSLRDGVIYDTTANGLIKSHFERVVGITQRGREAYQAMLKILEVDAHGVMAEKLTQAFIPLRPQ